MHGCILFRVNRNSNYYQYLGNKAFIKVYIRVSDTWSGFTQKSTGKAITSITDTVLRNGNTYYGVWVASSCTPASNSTCPGSGLSLVT